MVLAAEDDEAPALEDVLDEGLGDDPLEPEDIKEEDFLTIYILKHTIRYAARSTICSYINNILTHTICSYTKYMQLYQHTNSLTIKRRC